MLARTAIGIILVAIAILAWFWLRRPTSTVVSPGQLSYPCLRIYDGTLWERIDNETQLTSTPSGYYMNRKDDPLLVDSTFRVMRLSKLKMRGSELGLLVTGPRVIQIDFELSLCPEVSTAQAMALVLELIGKYEQSPTPLDSAANDTSLAGLIELLERMQRGSPAASP